MLPANFNACADNSQALSIKGISLGVFTIIATRLIGNPDCRKCKPRGILNFFLPLNRAELTLFLVIIA